MRPGQARRLVADIAGKQGLLLGGFNANKTLGAAFDPKTLLNSMAG